MKILSKADEERERRKEGGEEGEKEKGGGFRQMWFGGCGIIWHFVETEHQDRFVKASFGIIIEWSNFVF